MTGTSNSSFILNKLVMVGTVLLKHVSCAVVCSTATARLTGSLRQSVSCRPISCFVRVGIPVTRGVQRSSPRPPGLHTQYTKLSE